MPKSPVSAVTGEVVSAAVLTGTAPTSSTTTSSNDNSFLYIFIPTTLSDKHNGATPIGQCHLVKGTLSAQCAHWAPLPEGEVTLPLWGELARRKP